MCLPWRDSVALPSRRSQTDGCRDSESRRNAVAGGIGLHHQPSAAMSALFVYGTLMCPEVLRCLIGRIPGHRAASVPGLQRYALRDMIYPVVVPEADATTDGLLLLDLTLEEMVVLDEFEGDGYNRVELRPDQCHACGIPPEPAPSVYIGVSIWRPKKASNPVNDSPAANEAGHARDVKQITNDDITVGYSRTEETGFRRSLAGRQSHRRRQLVSARDAPLMETFRSRPDASKWAVTPSKASAPAASPPRIPRSLLVNLNPEQLRAVKYDGASPLIIVAGAGSGKTATLTMRIADLISTRHVSPEQILAVTFTRKAGDEMRARLHSSGLGALAGRVRACNFHQLCLSILKEHFRDAGFAQTPQVLSRDTQRRIVREAILHWKTAHKSDRLNVGVTVSDDDMSDASNEGDRDKASPGVSTRDINYFCDFIGKAKARRQKPNEFVDDHANIYAHYLQSLKSGGQLDFQDFVPLTIRLLKCRPNILHSLRQRWLHIIVDEYQDVSDDQFELIQLLVGSSGHLTVCGDDDQSIYAFRFGTSQSFNLLKSSYPKHELVMLTETYRSSPEIVQLASKVINHNKNRTSKAIVTTKPSSSPVMFRICGDFGAEVRDVVSQIRRLVDVNHMQLSDIAILCRTRSPLVFFARALQEALIPFEAARDEKETSGREAKQSKQVLDMIAYCHLICDPPVRQEEIDAAFLRVVNVPKRQIGKSTVDMIVNKQKQQKDMSLLKVASRLISSSDLPARARKSLSDFLSLIRVLKSQCRSKPNVETIKKIDAGTGYSAKTKMKGDLIGLIEVAQRADHAKATLAEMCEMCKASPMTPATSRNAVTLSTIHQAKGKEWTCVFVVQFNEGVIPVEFRITDQSHVASPKQASQEELLHQSHEHIEEERRICYVGLTRAKTHLFLSATKMDAKGKHRFQQGKQQNAPASEKNLHVRPQGRKGIHQRPRGKSK
ncbi:unnamed protein product (mitochondrion) [Plasmodiophora brassicae]|uniref:DNA 3'-5' helicase n=1 Tax=Plasmodiophora brassicae TaxID=37360 RepID=A0A3P3Y3D8_PLABS|nr:unnamed protein product [Plasmodiophora brassicae]